MLKVKVWKEIQVPENFSEKVKEAIDFVMNSASHIFTWNLYGPADFTRDWKQTIIGVINQTSNSIGRAKLLVISNEMHTFLQTLEGYYINKNNQIKLKAYTVIIESSMPTNYILVAKNISLEECALVIVTY
jgi:hypothetical protein